MIGGKEYGTGSSRDWAAKGPKLLGVRAVITESFERIHRSNLIGMGVAPFCFEAGKSRKDYDLTGREIDRYSRPVGRSQAAHADQCHHPLSRRQDGDAAAGADDHDGGRSRLFQEWRHSAVRPAQSSGRVNSCDRYKAMRGP